MAKRREGSGKGLRTKEPEAIAIAGTKLAPYFALRAARKDRGSKRTPDAAPLLGFLEPLFGSRPEHVVEVRDQYVVALVDPEDVQERSPLGQRMAVWNAATGAVVLRVAGAAAMAFSPNGAFVGVWREVRSNAKRIDWLWERYAFPSCELCTSFEVDGSGGGEPHSIDFIKKHDGALAKLVIADTDGPFYLYVGCGEPSGDRLLSGAEVRALKSDGAAPPDRRPEDEARDPTTRTSRLADIANVSHAVGRLVAVHRAADQDLLARLATSDDPTTRVKVLANAGVGRDTVLGRVDDRDVRVRRAAARALHRFDGVPLDVFERLAEDSDDEVRFVVASNPNVSEAAREALIASLSVSQRKNLSAVVSGALLERLLRDPDVELRRWVLTYHHARLSDESVAACVDDPAAVRATLPAAKLHALAADSHPGVRRSVVKLDVLSLEMLQGLAHDPDATVRRAVVALGKLDGEALAAHASDTDEGVREEVARSPHAADVILSALALDSSRKVQEAVAANPATRPEVLEALFERHRDSTTSFLVSQIVSNASAPRSLVERIAAESPNKITARKARDRLAGR